jgi:hypothetical protein
MINLYWPVYKSIEHELIELSNVIHIDDNQLSVYSVKISELLLRCVVEIEAISKELYFKNGGQKANDKDLYFDTDCIELLEQKWLLSKKKVIISSPSLYFQNADNKILTPLKKANKRGTSGADWAKAYQAVKHNRTQNLPKGNIKNLLRATAALFVLNLYYRDDITDLVSENNEAFSQNYSELFDIKVHKWHGDTNSQNSYLKKEDFDECVFFIKWTDDFKKKNMEWSQEHGSILNKLIFNHPKVKKYIDDNFIENGEIKQSEFSSFISKREYFKCFDMKTEYGPMIHQADALAKKKLNFDWRTPAKFEAVTNKQQEVYSFNS